jgi:hypothetical protein
VCVHACVELVHVCLGRLAAERMAEAVADRGVDLHETGRVVRMAHHDVRGVMQIVRVKSGVESHVRVRESRRARHARALGFLGL